MFNAKSLARQGIGAASAEGLSGHSSFYLYRTADTLAQVLATGYFNDARSRLKKGDVIDVVFGVGGTPAYARLMAEDVPSSGNVVVAAQTVAAGLRAVAFQHTQVAAVDTVDVPGLSNVAVVVASLDTDPADDNVAVSASIGDQAGAPAAGSALVKMWRSADGVDVTPVAAIAFGQTVNVVAFGTP